MGAKPKPDLGNLPPDFSSLALALTERAPLAMATVEGASHIIRYVNPAFCRLIAQPREQLVGKSFCRMFGEKDKCATLLDRVFRTGDPETHTEQEHTNSRPVFWSYSMWPVMADERPIGVMIEVTRTGQFQDKTLAMNEALMFGPVRQHELTEAVHSANVQLQAEIRERKRTEQQLNTSLKEVADLEFALDEHAIVAITDPQGKITGVNDRFCAISKYSREELLGQDHRLISSGHHPKEFIRELWVTIAGGKVWKGELKNKAKDGSFYWVDTTIVPFLNEQGNPRQYVAIRADITERKAVEEKLGQLNTELEQRVLDRTVQLQAANEQLQAFSYSVSHDLRSPLRHVMGFVQLLRKSAGPSLSEKSLRQLTTIFAAAKDMGNLIDDLLTFSRIGQSEMQKTEVSLDRLVSETLVDFQAETKERNIDWEIHPLPPVWADSALLRMVLVNLISNAVKFTGKRAEAKIEIGCAPGSTGETVIFIRDNGAGFDPRYADKLFGVFQRLHSQEDFAGTGIGLANVQRIIQRHGGRTWADGLVDGGATFYFSLINPKKGTNGH
jgi:PAS domain S-box-containing protein